MDCSESDLIDIYREIEIELKKTHLLSLVDACQHLIDGYYDDTVLFNKYRICMNYSVCVVKSYGHERRFFNPPPQIQIARICSSGTQNHTTRSDTITSSVFDSYISLQISGYDEDIKPSSDTLTLKNADNGTNKNICHLNNVYNSNNGLIPMDNIIQNLLQTDKYPSKRKKINNKKEKYLNPSVATMYNLDKLGVASAINTHINEFDFDRFIMLKIRVFLNRASNPIGPLESNPIRIISKPAKKKVKSLKISACNIISGSLIVLSNRFRSQSLSTKYLYLEEGSIDCHQYKYSAIYIYKVKRINDDYVNEDGPITYGSIVRLTSFDGKLKLPLMYIRKVDQNSIDSKCSDACLSMNRVAFECFDKPNTFLSLSTNNLRFHNLSTSSIEGCNIGTIDLFKSLSVWLVITVERIVFNYMTPVTSYTVSPSTLPLITMVTCSETVNEKRCFEVLGRDFYPQLQLFVGRHLVNTVYRCSSLLFGVVNNVNAMNLSIMKLHSITKLNDGFHLPILLVCPVQNIIVDTQYSAVFTLDMVSSCFILKVINNSIINTNISS